MVNSRTQATQNQTGLQQFWKNYALVLFLSIMAALIALLLTASVRMVIVAVSSQPDCVQHQKAVEQTQSNQLAAKSSC